jgi:MscS family membrane protein
VLLEVRVLEVLLWQWVALLLLAIAAWWVSWLIATAIVRILRPIFARTRTRIDDALFELAVPPLRLIVAIAIAAIGVRSLGLAVPALRVATNVLQALALLAIVWALSRFVDLVAKVIEGRLRERGEVGATGLVAPGRRTIKAVVGVIGIIAILDNFGFDVAALIAGLGVGGIAIALAAQKSVENLFGGITLYADQPVRVGDFFRWGDKVGTVEEIGLRSTRVRTLDRTIVTIPNAEFAGTQLENFAKRDRIRLHAMLGVRYETTPEQLRWLLVEIRKLLYSHEKLLPEPARIRFVGFGAYSLDLEIFAYVATADWNEFLGVREDLYLRIMDIVEASGSGFAFPSQTLYLGRDDGPDAETVERIEAEVSAWRKRDEVFLPDFPAERIAELDDTIRYPAEGSPARARG